MGSRDKLAFGDCDRDTARGTTEGFGGITVMEFVRQSMGMIGFMTVVVFVLWHAHLIQDTNTRVTQIQNTLARMEREDEEEDEEE
jgi:hypothetical protein